MFDSAGLGNTSSDSPASRNSGLGSQCRRSSKSCHVGVSGPKNPHLSKCLETLKSRDSRAARKSQTRKSSDVRAGTMSALRQDGRSRPPPAPVSPSNKLCRRGQTSMRTRGGLEPHAGERQKRQTTSPTREAKMCSRFLHGSVDKKRRPPIPPKRVHPCPEKRGAANNTGNPSGRSGPMTIVPRASARQKANMSESSEVPGRQLIAMSWNFVISQLIGPRRATYVYSPRYVVHVG